ncbi:unnamed protein product, partial [Rotaria magnacalcarata]
SSSPSNSNSQERDNLVQRWPELMKNIDRRIQRWTSRSDLLALVLIFCQGRLWLAAVQLSSPTSPPLKFYSKGYLIR